jgi:uncharacterized surface protein with fasciclin (FAS1) repeats
MKNIFSKKSICLFFTLFVFTMSVSLSYGQPLIQPGPPLGPPHGPPPYMPPCPADELPLYQTIPPAQVCPPGYVCPPPGAYRRTDIVDRSVNVYELMRRDQSLNRFTQLVDISGMGTVLAGEGAFTVFAPVNEAFNRYPQSMVWELARPENSERLRNMMSQHIVRGIAINPGQIQGYSHLRTIDGNLLQVRTREGRVFINDAQITGYHLTGSNGVVYLIDTPLVPGNGQHRVNEYMQGN